jgi:hypothetical protein
MHVGILTRQAFLHKTFDCVKGDSIDDCFGMGVSALLSSLNPDRCAFQRFDGVAKALSSSYGTS